MAGPVTALNPNQSSAPAAPDLAALKTKQQAAWSSGNYAIVGATLQIVGEELCEALDLKEGLQLAVSLRADFTLRTNRKAEKLGGVL